MKLNCMDVVGLRSKFILFLLVFSFFVGSVSAQTVEVDSFEDGNLDGWNTTNDISIDSNNEIFGQFSAKIDSSTGLSELYRSINSSNLREGMIFQISIKQNNYDSSDFNRFLALNNGGGLVEIRPKNGNIIVNGDGMVGQTLLSSPSNGEIYTVEIVYDPSSMDFYIYDGSGTQLNSITNIDSSSNYEFNRIESLVTDSAGSNEVQFVDNFSYISTNSPAEFNSFSTTPDNWSLNEPVDFSYNVSDSDGAVDNVTLEVFRDGNLQKEETFTYSSSTVTDTQVDWYTPDIQGSYTVYFTATDDDGAETVETIQKEVTDTEPPIYNSTNIYPDPPQIFESINYSAEVFDQASNLDDTCLNLTYGSSEILTNECRNPNTESLDAQEDSGSQATEFSLELKRRAIISIINLEPFSDLTGRTIAIEDSSGNVLASKTVDLLEDNWNTVEFSESDYSRIPENETLTITGMSNIYDIQRTYNGEFFNINNDYSPAYYGSSGGTAYEVTVFEDYQYYNVSWNDVLTPQTGNKWLNASFNSTDTEGNYAIDELNRYVEDSRPSFQINDPENITYEGQDVPYQIDFNDDGDNLYPEEAYCEAYNDGNLIRNETVSEDVEGTFSGTITNTQYGSHLFEVTCTEENLTKSTTKNVSYTTEEVPPTFSLNEPIDGDVFDYLEGTNGVSVTYNGSFESNNDLGGILTLINNVTGQVYQEDVSTGTTTYSVSETLTEGDYSYRLTYVSGDTGNFYESESRDFKVQENTNPRPVIENVSYDDRVSEDSRLGIDVYVSDSTNYLDRVVASAYNTRDNRLSRNVMDFTGEPTTGWKNFTNLGRTNRPGNYIIQVEVFDNFGFTTAQNYTVFSQESPASFDLVSPLDNVATGGTSNYTVSYDFSAEVPADGSLEVLSRSSDSGYNIVNTVNVSKGNYSNGEFSQNFTSIDYGPIAGEQYDASSRYSWYVRFNSSFSNDSYTSSIKDWRFTSERPSDVEEEDLDLFAYVRGIAIFIALLILAYIPLELRRRIGDNGFLG